MGDFINRLRELGVDDDGFVTLSYSEGCEVWHINESHVEESVSETATAELVAGLLVMGVPVYSGYGEMSEGSDILNDMRNNDELEDYDRGGEYFQDYLTEKLQTTIYDGEYALEYSTEQYDYKIYTVRDTKWYNIRFTALCITITYQFVSSPVNLHQCEK